MFLINRFFFLQSVLSRIAMHHFHFVRQVIPKESVQCFKAKLVGLAEQLMKRDWKSLQRIDVRIYCARRPERDALNEFLSAVFFIADMVIRPTLVTVATVNQPMEVVVPLGYALQWFCVLDIGIMRNCIECSGTDADSREVVV